MATNRNEPLVTVGIPFFNAKPYLELSIRSVFAQSLSSWELILLDDASTDGSLDLACSVQDPRVRLILQRPNRGIAHGLNTITENARGHYIAQLHADDLMHPTRLERQLRYMLDHPECSVIGTGSYLIDAHSTPVGRVTPAFCPGAHKGPLILSHPTIMGRKAWFLENPYNPGFTRAEDYELWMRTLGGTANIPEPLTLYRSRFRWRAYCASAREKRVALLQHGPKRFGWNWSMCEIVNTYAKTSAYAFAGIWGAQERLFQYRHKGISEADSEVVRTVIACVRQTSVPGWDSVLDASRLAIGAASIC